MNGETREVADEISLQDLVDRLELTSERVAIELNGTMVKRADWTSKILQDNDRVEIVHFVGGGCYHYSKE